MLVFHSKQLSLPTSMALLCTKISDKYKLAWWFFSCIIYMYATVFQLGKGKDSQTLLLALTFRLGKKREMGVGKGRRKDESKKSLSDTVCVCVCVCVCVFWSLHCVWLFVTPMDCSSPRSSVRGILQTRILHWVAISFPRGSSQPRDQTQVFCFAGWSFSVWATVIFIL